MGCHVDLNSQTRNHSMLLKDNNSGVLVHVFTIHNKMKTPKTNYLHNWICYLDFVFISEKIKKTNKYSTLVSIGMCFASCLTWAQSETLDIYKKYLHF